MYSKENLKTSSNTGLACQKITNFVETHRNPGILSSFHRKKAAVWSCTHCIYVPKNIHYKYESLSGIYLLCRREWTTISLIQKSFILTSGYTVKEVFLCSFSAMGEPCATKPWCRVWVPEWLVVEVPQMHANTAPSSSSSFLSSYTSRAGLVPTASCLSQVLVCTSQANLVWLLVLLLLLF